MFSFLFNKLLNYIVFFSGLISAANFYVCKAFGLRSRDEHRHFTLDQLVFGADALGNFVQFFGKTAKNHRGGLHHKNVALKQVKQYDTDSPVSTFKILKAYICALNECGITEGPFYRRPLMPLAGKLSFSKVPLGIHSISQLLPKAAATAGIKGLFTGHSAKASCATTLFQSDVDEQLIMERTGHRSSAVRSILQEDIECATEGH